MSKSCIKRIYEQMNNCFYKVITKDGNHEIGCFIHIKHGNKIYSILMTLINVLQYINNNNLNIIMNNEPKQIELGDLKYGDKEYNICLIEIKDNNNDNIQYMEIDENIFKSELDINYYKESIYVIQYNNKSNISVSYGIINEIFKNEIRYSSNIDVNSKLSLIFNLNNNKIIGINKYRSNYYYKGIFFIFIKLIRKMEDMN